MMRLHRLGLTSADVCSALLCSLLLGTDTVDALLYCYSALYLACVLMFFSDFLHCIINNDFIICVACSNIVVNVSADKPGKGRDFYHTCYALSGLSIAQHHHSPATARSCYGDSGNMIKRTAAVFNIGADKAAAALKFYSIMPHTHEELIALAE